MSLLYRGTTEAPGLHDRVSPDNSPLQLLSLLQAQVDAGGEIALEAASQETAIVLLEGASTVVSADGERFDLGPRRSVFEDRASACYLPPGLAARVACGL